MAEFDPRQLDALEDALEAIDTEGFDPNELELEPVLRERLAEYAGVLSLTREALPLEEVPANLLQGVIARAHDATRHGTVAPTESGRWRRVWARWRTTLVPLATLTGAAAVVLWLAKPEPEPTVARASVDERAAEGDSEVLLPELAQSTTSSEHVAPAAHTSEAEAPDPIAVEPAPEPVRRSTPGGTSKAAAPPVEVAPAPTHALSKDDAWKTLERGDAARRKGDCDRARQLYEQVVAAGSQSSALARAKAGIGLCFEQDRRSDEADQWFEEARVQSPGIDSWIRTQRDEQPLPGEKKKSKMKDSAFEATDAL